MPSPRIPAFPASLRKASLASLKRASDWLVRNQVKDTWPAWDANAGRFPYHILIDPAKRAKKPQVLSTCWKTSRTAQGLYSAYAVTGNKKYQEAADRAIVYIKALQYFDPAHPYYHGTFREDSTLGKHVTFRDGIEAIQALIQAAIVSKDKDALERARIGTDFFLKHYQAHDFMTQYVVPDTGRTRHLDMAGGFWLYAGAMIMVEMYSLTKDKKYLTKGAVPMMDTVCDELIMPSGALGMEAAGAANAHHFGTKGPLKGVLSNDDGLSVALLMIYRATGKKKYLDAAIGVGDFWTEVDAEPALLAANPSIALFLADLCRETGDKKYIPAISRLIKRTIALQCIDKDPLLKGGFMGEDMAKHYDKKTKPLDYVDTRITSYALIALAKIAAEKSSQWSCAYSCFGY